MFSVLVLSGVRTLNKLIPFSSREVYSRKSTVFSRDFNTMMIMNYDEYEQERKEHSDKIHRLEKTSLRCLTDYKFLKEVMMGRNNIHAANVF